MSAGHLEAQCVHQLWLYPEYSPEDEHEREIHILKHGELHTEEVFHRVYHLLEHVMHDDFKQFQLFERFIRKELWEDDFHLLESARNIALEKLRSTPPEPTSNVPNWLPKALDIDRHPDFARAILREARHRTPLASIRAHNVRRALNAFLDPYRTILDDSEDAS